MKITFIRPRITKNMFFETDKTEPLAIGILASKTPPDIEIEFFDERIEPILYDKQTDLVGISVETFTAKKAYEISSQFRKRGVPVILGGFHPTLVPDEAIQYADSVVIGEVENVWNSVIQDAKNNKLRKFYRSEQRPSLAGVIPNREIFKNKHYVPFSLVEFGRGCKHSCNFCSVSSFYNHSHSTRPIREVIEEVETLHTKNIFFVDDNIIADVDSAKKLFKELIPLNIRWAGQAGIESGNDKELLELMEKSGCRCLLIGLESLNKNNLIQMNKSKNIKIEYEASLNRIYAYGIMVWGSFVLGYNCDTIETIKETLDFALKQKFFLANFYQLIPYPGTFLYNTLLKEKRLLYKKWWLDPAYRFGEVVFQPKSISPDELAQGCWNAKQQFYNYSEIFNRWLGLKVNRRNFFNSAIFFFYNFVCRKETIKKHNMSLG